MEKRNSGNGGRNWNSRNRGKPGGKAHGHDNPRRNQRETPQKSSRSVSAPYNFVPLSEWVYLPEWGAAVSHDIPFHDGFNGTIAFTLVTRSPLLVGDRPNRKGQGPSEVRPFKMNGRAAISGSSLKGMLRSVVEIVGFGRMRMVDQVRPGLRDISGRYVKDAYSNKIRGKIRSGWLRRYDDGRLTIVPCRHTRVSHQELARCVNAGDNDSIFTRERDVQSKYSTWRQRAEKAGLNPDQIRFRDDNGRAVIDPEGENTGCPVFTGMMRNKRSEHLFYSPEENSKVEVPTEVWRDFIALHGDNEAGKRARALPWPGYWRDRFRQGREVPVFFAGEGQRLKIGLAGLPKLAGDFSVHDMIGHAASEHLDEPGMTSGYDLADLMFGAVNSDVQQDALRGRVSIETAVAREAYPEKQQDPTILNGPKPSFFPNYLRQPGFPGPRLQHGQYTTYMETPSSREPVIRGYKRYPVRTESLTHVQPPTDAQRTKGNVQVQLFTLPAGAAFESRIHVHNLRLVELGCLLWAMTWGGRGTLHHSLGMGKSFGFGQVVMELDESLSRIEPNDPELHGIGGFQDLVEKALRAFVDHMEVACKRNGNSWLQSPQIRNLLAMADPGNSMKWATNGRGLRHMSLDEREFQFAKNSGLILEDYANATKYTVEPTAAEKPDT